MKLLDERGRLFGWINLFDLFVVSCVVAFVVIGYVHLTAPHRAAPPFALKDAEEWVEVTVMLPNDMAWLEAHLELGLTERDGRSGDVTAEVVGVELVPDGLAIRMRVRAMRDAQGRLTKGPTPLLPGQKLRVETPSAVIEGPIAKIHAHEES